MSPSTAEGGLLGQQMFPGNEEDVHNNVCVNVDFVLDNCGFIFFFSSIYIQMTLKFYYLLCAWICMSLALNERFKRTVSLCYTGES